MKSTLTTERSSTSATWRGSTEYFPRMWSMNCRLGVSPLGGLRFHWIESVGK